MGLGAAAALPSIPAWADETSQEIEENADELEAQAEETQREIDAAQAEYDELHAQLEEAVARYEELAIQQAQTLDKIYGVEEEIRQIKAQIADTEAQIAAREEELATKQEILARRITSSYKSGSTDFLEVLLSSSTFEELASNIYYLDKISQNDAKLIADVKQIRAELIEQKAQLEADQAELEAKLAELEELNAIQQQQLDEIQATRDSISQMLSNVSDRVQALIAERDAELLAAEQERQRARDKAEEEERQRQQEEEERRRQEEEEDDYDDGGDPYYYYRVDPDNPVPGGTGSQQAVINACYSVPSPGGGLCAWWVEDVFEAAGVGSWGGNACDLYNAYCYSSDVSAIQPGMIIAVSTYPTSGLGAIYGHVGVYVGGGLIRENIGYINTSTLSAWIANYSGYVTPRWGWMGGVALA